MFTQTKQIIISIINNQTINKTIIQSIHNNFVVNIYQKSKKIVNKTKKKCYKCKKSNYIVQNCIKLIKNKIIEITIVTRKQFKFKKKTKTLTRNSFHFRFKKLKKFVIVYVAIVEFKKTYKFKNVIMLYKLLIIKK